MSAKRKEAPAGNGGARNGRAVPMWFATQPPPGCDGGQLVRQAARGPARTWAWCDSHARAMRLAAALNREERATDAAEGLSSTLRTVSDIAARLRGALRRLVDAGARVPVLRDGGAFAKALAEARRVLGDEPTFAPGGEEVAR